MDNKVNTCEERFAKRAQKPTDAKPRAISSSGAASAEAKLVWIMPSRDRARRSQAYLNIAEVRTDGAASAEPSPGLSYVESRQRKTKSRRKTKSTCLDYAESRQRKTKSNEDSITCLLLKVTEDTFFIRRKGLV